MSGNFSLTPPSVTYIQGQQIKDDTSLWSPGDAADIRQKAHSYREVSQMENSHFSAAERAQLAEDAEYLERKLEEYDSGAGMQLRLSELQKDYQEKVQREAARPQVTWESTEPEPAKKSTSSRSDSTYSRSSSTYSSSGTTSSDTQFKTKAQLEAEGYHRRNLIDVITGNGNGNGSYYVPNR